MEAVRVAYTLEQCWQRVPGGTALAALRTADAIQRRGDVELIGVAGKHHDQPRDPYKPNMPVRHLPLAAPWLYQAWLRVGWPRPESVVPEADVVHATTVISCPTRKPLVVTIHDLAFLHDPTQFTANGVRVFTRSVELIKRHADLILCSSQATIDDCLGVGLEVGKLRHVPLGVEAIPAAEAEISRVRQKFELPRQFVLFVGTVEPRKNLKRLAQAMARLGDPLPLIVAGESGWGDVAADVHGDVRFLGFVATADLNALYAAAEVFCYPSEREGYGLPVLEAMVQGTPVVTSQGTSTEEAAGGAAVLVDPFDIADIARGITEARQRRAGLSELGRARAGRASWDMTAELTVAAYRELA